MRTSIFIFVLGLVFIGSGYSQPLMSGRNVQLFNQGWKFICEDTPNAEKSDFIDKNWRSVDLPHDWSIEGPFNEKWASATGYLPGGIGWYRKAFSLSKSMDGSKIFIYFEGVYNNSEVWINGHYLGKRPNGYISFQYDLTQYLNFEKSNVIAVKVDHSKYGDSRWYTGSGIYRDVNLIITSPIHIIQPGNFITTPEVTSQKAKVAIEVPIVNESSKDAHITIENCIIFHSDTILRDKQSLKLTASREFVLKSSFEIINPKLWDIEHPDLYKLVTFIRKEGTLLDNQTTNFGIRSIRFDADKRFFLNDKSLKLKGVCLHHDAGCLGAAVPKKVMARRLDILKEMGCNAIRTSHNAYSSDFLELCDEKGFLVKDEAFDEWELPKRKWLKGWNVGDPGLDGYSEYFKEWHKRDLTDQILRDRNHPSVIMWSIGNEVDYPADPYTHPILDSEANPQTWAKHNPKLPDGNRLGEIAKELVAIVKQYDTTRPVSAGLASVLMSNETGYADALDAVGYNYQEFRYEGDHKKYPKRIIFGSENGMALDAWKTVAENDYVLGQFLWTGIEYLGEAGKFPNRSNTAGAIDLAGNKKTEFYFRQSLWSEKPMVYIGTSDASEKEEPGNLWSHKKAEPIWNWKKGQLVKVSVFSNCEDVELFLNDKSLGLKKMSDFPAHVIIWEIPFENGILKAVAKEKGKELASYELKTAGVPAQLVARADSKVLHADSRDVSHIAVEIADSNGNLVYNSNNEISCEVSGPIKLLGLEDANPNNIEDYKDNKQTSYNGKVLIYIQSLDKPGKAFVKITSSGLKPVVIEIDVKK